MTLNEVVATQPIVQRGFVSVNTTAKTIRWSCGQFSFRDIALPLLNKHQTLLSPILMQENVHKQRNVQLFAKREYLGRVRCEDEERL